MEAKPFQVPCSSEIVPEGVENEIIKLRPLITLILFCEQDLLLSLGRKRLAEARKAASAHRAAMARKGLQILERQAQRNAQNGDESVSSRLTNRIRSDVKGLRNAFRKSFKDSVNSNSSSNR